MTNLCILTERDGKPNYCEQHKMYHGGHYAAYAIDPGEKGRVFRDLWDRQRDEPKPVSTATKISNYIGDLRLHRKHGKMVLPDEVRNYRASECEPCEYRDKGKNACTKCGCPLYPTILGDKLAWAVSKCPIGKWSEWIPSELIVDGDWVNRPEAWAAFRWMMTNEIERLKKQPLPIGDGEGIVIVGGGKYFASVYCNVRLIRQHGCTLPIEVWYLGRKNEMPDTWAKILQVYGVKCVDADEFCKRHPTRILNGWELKPYAVAYSAFRRLIFLDADCFPMRDPTFTLHDPRFLGAGAVFQRDCHPYEFIKEDVLKFFGISDRYTWDTESGVFLVDKQRWNVPLGMALFLNSYSDLVYQVVYGDKTTFPLAAKVAGYTYATSEHVPTGGGWGLMQRWFDGSEMWQHRIHCKPTLKDESFTSHQASVKEKREMVQELSWSNEIRGYLSDLRKLLHEKERS